MPRARSLIFCSGTVALNRLVTNPTYPGIVADYRKTFARAKEIKADILLAPHPEMYKMQEKRAKIADGAPNPFVNRRRVQRLCRDAGKGVRGGAGQADRRRPGKEGLNYISKRDVVPANAGTHIAVPSRLGNLSRDLAQPQATGDYGSLRSQGRRLGR